MATATATSPLMAMHQRYEQAFAGYIAENEARKDQDDSKADALQRALRAISRETDALRTAILHQVPRSWPEAMVLQSHIVTAFDSQVSCPDVRVDEAEALQTAIDTLFDFMCCEVEQDHAEIGADFQTGAIRVHVARRYRTGETED